MREVRTDALDSGERLHNEVGLPGHGAVCICMETREGAEER